MTDLQASLIAIGGAIVVGVISYNKWQEYRARKSVQRAFSGEHDDVLMGSGATPRAASGASSEERQEPSFSDARVEAGARANGFADASQPDMDDRDDSAGFAHTLQQKPLPVDELVDCIIPLSLVGGVRGEKI